MLETYQKKSNILKSIRDYFYNTAAIEIFTDIAQDYPNLDPNIYPVELFFYNEKKEKIKKYLHTSPELQMKKILSQIKKDIFQITKVFRNFEGSSKHKIEFTMLEWYRIDYSLEDLMEDTKNIFINSCRSVYNSEKFIYKDKVFDLSDWEKITVEEAFYRYTGTYLDVDNLNRFLKEREKTFRYTEDFEELFYRVYAFYVEPNLGIDKPTFIYDYPPEFAALSKVENGKAKRFEVYINGIELVNGYQELNDSQEQLKRFKEEIERKKREGFNYEIDYEFIECLKELPECSGASLGIDRLFMVLLNKDSIYF
ncbi:MAG: elongation factor P--(R)-beta-lysine ligase [Hydrogenothermaceae bacterium]|nr:elongation factor P--(R)-beta-lysine ligase [Hydrogenothermaceae bacterium]